MMLPAQNRLAAASRLQAECHSDRMMIGLNVPVAVRATALEAGTLAQHKTNGRLGKPLPLRLPDCHAKDSPEERDRLGWLAAGRAPAGAGWHRARGGHVVRR